MDLESSFQVTAPIEEVWATVMDVERIATAVPGAELTDKLSDTSYQGVVKVKVGPLTMQYKGQIELVSRDDATHTAVFKGKAREKAGQGTAEGTATVALTEDGGVTTGTVSGEISLSGKAAAMGKGVINTVAQQIMGIFAGNLQNMLGGGSDGGGETSGGAVDGLAVARGVIGSMFRRGDKDKDGAEKSEAED